MAETAPVPPAGAPPAAPVVDDDDGDTTDWKAEARKWETRAKKSDGARKDAEEKARQQALSESEKAVEAARKDAADAARAEVTAAYQGQIATAELRAAAAGKLADPADVSRFIDVADLDVDKDGKPTTKSMTAALEQLLKDKPYLAAAGGRPAGSADGGTRGGARAPQNMNDLIRSAAGHR